MDNSVVVRGDPLHEKLMRSRGHMYIDRQYAHTLYIHRVGIPFFSKPENGNAVGGGRRQNLPLVTQ